MNLEKVFRKAVEANNGQVPDFFMSALNAHIAIEGRSIAISRVLKLAVEAITIMAPSTAIDGVIEPGVDFDELVEEAEEQFVHELQTAITNLLREIQDEDGAMEQIQKQCDDHRMVIAASEQAKDSEKAFVDQPASVQ